MVKNLLASAGDKAGVDQIPVGTIPGGENGFPLQYSCLENPRDRGAEPTGSQRVGHNRATECVPAHEVSPLLEFKPSSVEFHNFCFDYS